MSLLTTELFGAGEKLALARVLGTLGGGTPADARGRSLDEWLAARALPRGVRELLRTAARLSCYAEARSSAVRRVTFGAPTGCPRQNQKPRR